MGHVNEYSALTQWLADDVGDLHDLTVIERTAHFVNQLTDAVNADPTRQEPSYLEELRQTLRRVDELPDAAGKLAYLSAALRSLFVGVTMTEAHYRAHAESLFNGNQLAHRLQSRAPLPTTDAMLLLAPDPRHPTGAQRAALLTAAAVEQIPEGVPLLGTTQVPGESVDEMVHAIESRYILVLSAGLTYIISLPGAVDPQDLCDAFHWIEQDAAESAAWAGQVPPLVTAAKRITCFHIRRLFENDAENRAKLAAIDRCRFAVCLDRESTSGDVSMEGISRRLFGNYHNRWYGMTMFAVTANGDAAIIASYTRGIEALPILAFGDAIFHRSCALALPAVRGDSALGIEAIEFPRMSFGEWEERAKAEIAATFHEERAFCEIEIGTGFLRSLGVSPNSALQYLLMLAAQKVMGSPSLPAVSHAVSTRDGAGLKGGMDWIVVSTIGVEKMLDPGNAANLRGNLVQSANRHAGRVRQASNGYSPSLFLRPPEDELDALVYRFFLEIGIQYQTAYRSYLFRPTRWPGTIDILTSTLRLPDSISFCGRPGSTCEVAALFGLHIVMKADRTSLFFIPNPNTVGRLREFHRALEELVHLLKSEPA